MSRPFFVTLSAASRGHPHAQTSKEAKQRMADVNEHLDQTYDWTKFKGTSSHRSQSAGKSSSSSKSADKKQQHRSDDRSRSRGAYTPQRSVPYSNETERGWHFASSDPRYKHYFCVPCKICYVLPITARTFRRCKSCAAIVSSNSPDPNTSKGMVLSDFTKEWITTDTWTKDQTVEVIVKDHNLSLIHI